MRKYTTITIDREIAKKLEELKNSINAKSLGDTIQFLINQYRLLKAIEFANSISQIRENCNFKELRKIISELREKSWAKLT